MTSPDDFGLKLLVKPSCPSADVSGHRLDVIAVHGVNGHYTRTWSSNKTLWLSDVLPNRIPNARVMSFGYRSNPRTGLGLVDAEGLRQIARDLLQQLQDMRTPKTDFDEGVPIVFIGHNLGGVVIKELLWIANNEATYLRIAAHTTLVVLFGTPLDSCPWVDTVFNITLASTEEEPFIFHRREILNSAIRKGPGAVVAASARFHNLADQYEIISIFESKPTPFVGNVVSGEYAAKNQLGDRYTKFERDTDHLRLCRFSTECDKVLDALCEKLGAAASGPIRDGLYEYLECRLIITTLYPEITNIPIAPRTPGTLEWSKKILAQSAPIIHIFGLPGSGKSVLATHLANLASENNTDTILSFQFSQLDSRRETSNNLLLSFLRQLLFKLKNHSIFQSSYVRSFYEEVSWHGRRTLVDLWGLFRAILAALPDTKFVCIVDAIDECDATRNQLLGNIVRLQEHITTTCKFIIISRAAEDIRSYLKEYPAIDLDAEDNMKSDKELFIDQRTQECPTISHIADGLCSLDVTFLQLELIMTILEDSPSSTLEPISSSRLVSEKLDYLQLYNHLPRNIQPADRNWFSKALSWIVFTVRPLTVYELAVAIAINSNPGLSSVAQIEKHIRPNMMDDLRRTLGALVKIENNEVHLAHRTVRDFLVEHRGLPSELDFGQGNSQQIHAQLASTCLRYLCFNDISTGQQYYTRVGPQLRLQHPFRSSRGFEFLDYAILHWAMHVRQAPSDKLLDQVLGFLQNSTAIQWWSTVYWMTRAPNTTSEPAWDVDSPLTVMAHLGFAEIVEELLKNSPERYPPENRKSALGMAVKEGHATAAATILQTGGLELEMGVLALKKACEFGRESVVKLVLDFWKEDRTALELNTCLCIATEYGQAKIVRLLVDAGADVNTTNSADNAQPLILAAGRGYEATVLELLGANADVEARHSGTTALQYAAKSGHLAALQALLYIGRSSIGATTSDSKGQTALHLAAEAGHAALVHELLEKGADKEFVSTLWDFRPLHCAAWKGHDAVIQTLLDVGTEISPLDDEGFTPLALACMKGHLKSVKVLLSHGADAELPAIARNSRRSLHFAAEEGYPHLVRALLESGVSEDPVTKPGKETPLHLAVGKSDRLEVVKTLLEYEVNVNKRRLDGASALHIAVRSGDLDVAEALLRAGADFTAVDSKNQSPLHVAAKWCAIATAAEMVDLLVKQGADVNQLDENQLNNTYLLSAIAKNRLDDVKFLLDKGVDPSTANSDGWSTLHVAARNAEAEVLKVLLTWDADVSKVDQNGCSPLFQAAALGSTEKLKLLLEYGCDPNLPDKFGRLPCDVAHWPEVRVLLSPAAYNPEPEAVCALFSHVRHNIWPEWRCYVDTCRRQLSDEVFYHCCLCGRSSCSSSHCFDICADCRLKGIGCKKHILRARFYSGGMLSFEERSPAIRNFGLPLAEEDLHQSEPAAETIEVGEVYAD